MNCRLGPLPLGNDMWGYQKVTHYPEKAELGEFLGASAVKFYSQFRTTFPVQPEIMASKPCSKSV